MTGKSTWSLSIAILRHCCLEEISDGAAIHVHNAYTKWITNGQVPLAP
jgi:hypothetical protein